MYRRRSRYSRRVKSIKYSNETMNYINNAEISAGSSFEADGVLIPSVANQGTRKVKNFDLQFMYENLPFPVAFALVYVPEGQEASSLTLSVSGTPASLYEPNQNVIMSGILPPSATNTIHYRTRLARNLNSGDTIQIVLKGIANAAEAADFGFYAQLNYAIAY